MARSFGGRRRKRDLLRLLCRFGTALTLVLLLSGFDRPPWWARRRPHPRPNRLAQLRAPPEDWPDEPQSPGEVDPERFERALKRICGWMRRGRSRRYAAHLLRAAAEFDIDPFLLGALMYRESRCRAPMEGGDRGSGRGLTLIHRPMYASNLRHGRLRYRVLTPDGWVERVKRVDRFPFAEPRLAQAEPNLYFAAALLSAWRDQQQTLQKAFAQRPHRHFVSHFIWGDRVRSHCQENRILTDRRRLLEYYGAHRSRTVSWGGLTFGCPLFGCPRVISSWLGSERDAGARRHRGVDIDSLPNEPVRAVAEGSVVFAGVDLPGQQSHVQVRSEAGYGRFPRRDLGAGGRYVCLRHPRDGLPSVRSCYMHLERVTVRYGQAVRRGDQVGTVGRTGMQRSAAHLHLELRSERLEDPADVLYGLLLGHREADPTQ